MSEGAGSTPRQPESASRIRSPRDFWGGLVLVALALFAFWAASDLPGMQGANFGPGTAPRLVAGLLLAVGAVITLLGLIFDGPPIERYAVRGPVFIILAILAFAGMIRSVELSFFGFALKTVSFGLAPSTFFAFMIAIMGSREMRLIESVLTAAAMTVFCVGLFVYLLELPFDLWPQF